MEPQLQRPIPAPQHLAPLPDPGPRLNNLPLDVTFNILEECSAYDIISLESTCHSIRASIRSTQGCAIFINRVKQDSYEAMTIYHIDKIQIEQQKWSDRRWKKDKSSSAAPVPWTIAMESEQDTDYVEPGFPAAKALREFKMEDQPLDEQCKDLRKYIKLAEFFSFHCRLALARKRRGLGIKVEEPDANDITTRTTYMHNTAGQNQNHQNDQLSPFLQCHIGAEWPSHIRGDNWIWVPACEKIFGTQQEYNYYQFGRIAAMKEFIGQCLGAYLVWCDSLWRRQSLVRGINIQSGPGGQKGMLENHIQCYVGLCTKDKGEFRPLRPFEFQAFD
ncbi:hypothetical protein TWF192_010365 [Orbilia oligospora]|uniref:F-box domain-containing protein n=1 Tax=Orbilia oligospora TaxID=2813651 RepID=A0A6G1LYD6_ORBOL|nr:hypothetical protein TWF191_000579 [Orbilia oligospora]KAF3238351.1 hypothetical protein TWF192_010365 [Orbilia oligospora]